MQQEAIKSWDCGMVAMTLWSKHRVRRLWKCLPWLMAGCLCFLVSKCDNNIKQLQVMSPSCFSPAFEYYFRFAKIANVIWKNREKAIPYPPKNKWWRASDSQRHGYPVIGPRLSKVHLHLGEGYGMNSSNMQTTKGTVRSEEADAVGVLSSPRLEHSSSNRSIAAPILTKLQPS